MAGLKRRRTDRRRAKDFWSRTLPFLLGGGWIVLLVTLLVYHRASPEFYTLFDAFYQLKLRRVWDNRFVRYLLISLSVGLGISFVGMVLGAFRARRKTDQKPQLIVLVFAYLLLAVLCLRLV